MAAEKPQIIVQQARQKSFEGSQDPFRILTIAIYRSKAMHTSMMLLVSTTIVCRKENNEQATGPSNCKIDLANNRVFARISIVCELTHKSTFLVMNFDT